MGTQNTRREKIEWLRGHLEMFFTKKPEGSVSREKLLSEFVLATASTWRSGIELLKVIAMIDGYKIEGDEIYKRK